MSEFRKTNGHSIKDDLRAFGKWLDEEVGPRQRTHAAKGFNTWMDVLLREDFFGTEGQSDPRGDHRD